MKTWKCLVFNALTDFKGIGYIPSIFLGCLAGSVLPFSWLSFFLKKKNKKKEKKNKNIMR
jgi:hypothetical protein